MCGSIEHHFIIIIIIIIFVTDGLFGCHQNKNNNYRAHKEHDEDPKRSCKHELLIGSVNTCDMKPRDKEPLMFHRPQARCYVLRVTLVHNKETAPFLINLNMWSRGRPTSLSFGKMYEVTTKI
jgi:hypothetical protein